MNAHLVRFVVARLAGAAFLIVGVAVLAFLLVRALPGDPAQSMLGMRATPDDLERLRREMGLDRPLMVQFLDWASAALRLDFGPSLGTGTRGSTAVSVLVAQGATVTLALTVLGTTLAALIGVPAGLGAAAMAGKRADRAISAAATLFLSVPPFYLAWLMILLFSVYLGWLPSVGYVPPGDDLARFLELMILPATAVGLINAAPIARTTRAAAVEIAAQGHVQLLRMNGTPPVLIWGRHVLRGVLIPVLTVTGLQIGYLLGGVVVIENMFALPGMGRQLLIASEQRDYNTMQALIVIFAAAFVAVNLVVDLLYLALDPRVRPRPAAAGTKA